MKTTEEIAPISKEEIDWVRSKHAGLVKSARRILMEAMEIGQWFIEAEGRMGFKKAPNGKRSREWGLWASAYFPEIHLRVLSSYIRLAEGRDYVEHKLASELTSDLPPTITRALRLLADRDREQKEDQDELKLPPAEFEEPLLILRDQLKSYVYQQFQVQYLAEQIRFRIKTAKLGRRQIRQAVEWATQEHLEIREFVLKEFLR